MKAQSFLMVLIFALICVSNINSDVVFNELFNFSIESASVNNFWFEDYDNDDEDEFLIQNINTNNIQVYELTGELIDTYNENLDIFHFTYNNIEYQIDWINEYDSIDDVASLKIYFREEQSQIILDSLSIYYNTIGIPEQTTFTVNNVEFTSNNIGEIILISGNYHCFDYDYHERNINYIYVLSLENNTLQHSDTLENYGHTLFMNTNQTEIVSHGYNEHFYFFPDGSWQELTVSFGKYNIETQTLIENFQYYGIREHYLGNDWWIHFPMFMMLINDVDFIEYGAVFHFKVRQGTQTEIINQVIRMNHTLTDTIWIQEDLFLQSNGWINIGARLGNVLGDDKLILFGKTSSSQSNLEIVNLDNGNSIHNQQIEINSSGIRKIIKDSFGKVFIIIFTQNLLGSLYEIDESSYVLTEDLTIYDTQLRISNFPNPFNPETKIVFNLHESGQIRLEIYNIKGQRIKSLLNDQITAGKYSIIWDGKDASGQKVSSGVYLYKLLLSGRIEVVKKCLLLK